MKQRTSDAIRGGFISFVIFDIPLFILGLWLDNKIMIVNFDLSSITPYIYVVIPIFGAIIFVVGGHLQTKGRKHLLLYGISDPPIIVSKKLSFPHFGVIWRVLIGPSSRNMQFYVEGCYCPKCNCELMSDTRNRFFGWGVKYIWKCSDNTCGFTISRPKAFIFKEEDAIRNIAKREYEKGSG